MNNSVLIRVFNSLSNKEVRDLAHFVRSPYFNRREKVVKLYEYLVETKDLSIEGFEKKRAWKYIFPHQEYEDSEMRYTMSFLLKVMRQFLIQQELESDLPQSQVLLCQSFHKHGLSQLMEKEINHSLKLQQKENHRHAFFHLNNYRLEMIMGNYISQQKRTGDVTLQQQFDELTHFYIAEILRQSCNILNHQTVAKRDYDLRLQQEVIQHVEQHDYTHIPAIAIYYHSYKALSDLGNESHFAKLKTLLQEHWASFPTIESHGLYVLAINYCIKKLNQGDRKYIREGFELYKSGLENDVFLDNDILSSFTYTNVTRLGLALKEFTWVEQFLSDYKLKLHPRQKENIYLYNRAFFYFQKPDYDNAMSLLQQVNVDDVFLNLDARRMLLRIYYERQEFSALSSLLESFKIYISRQKKIGYHRDNYLNLIRFMKKMLNRNLSSSRVRKGLIEEIEKTPSIAEKEWLLEQLK